MKLEEDILIEKYLRNLLSKAEKNNFLNRLSTDENFKKNYLLEKELFLTLNDGNWNFISNKKNKEINEYKEIFKSDIIVSLKKTLGKENQIFQNKNNVLNKKQWYYLPVAAVLLFIVSFFYFTNLHKSNKELFNYYLNDSNIPSLITRGDVNTNLIVAQQLFEENSYKEALHLFAKNNSQIQNATVSIYIGVSQSKLNLNNEALLTFDSLINSKLLDAPKGKWFKALIYLKLDSVSKSKKILKDIVSNESYNFVKAKELLQKLD